MERGPGGEALDPAAVERLRSIAGSGPPGALARLAEAFLDGAPRLLAGMAEAAGSGDLPALERAAHTLKSNAAGFGATALSDLCREIETRARAGKVEGADALPRAATDEWERARTAVQRLLGDLGDQSR